MYTFLLRGEMLVAADVSVVAPSLDEAIERAQQGEFSVENTWPRNPGFKWNGEEDEVTVTQYEES